MPWELSSRSFEENPVVCAVCHKVSPRTCPNQVVCRRADSPHCSKTYREQSEAIRTAQRAKERGLRSMLRLGAKLIYAGGAPHPYAHLEKEMVRLYRAGYSANRIARTLAGASSLSSETVIRVVRRHGVKVRPTRRPPARHVVATYSQR